MPEKDVSSAVRDLLDAEHIPYWRMNSGKRIGSYTSKKTGKVKNWAIRLQKPGTADLLCAPNIRRKVCKHGDPFCPCQDGDQCHYEGKNPMLSSKSAGRLTTEAMPETSPDDICYCGHNRDGHCEGCDDGHHCLICACSEFVDVDAKPVAGRAPEPLPPAANGHNRAWLWIELKAGKRGQTPEQQEFQRYVEERNMYYLLLHEKDATEVLLAWLREHK